MLSRSDLPDKCWAGVCLLGVTSTACSSARFLASYSDWFNVLLSHIQSSGASQFVKVASCAAVSDLLTRLSGFANLKKDGNSYAGKLVQPILNMFNEDVTEAVSDVAAHLLLTILNHFPSSVHRHHDNVECVIVSKIMSANYSDNVLKKLSCCLASLPKSRGDEDSWSLMMQKILLSLNALLNSTLEGLEEETRRVEAVTLLVPPGRDPPPSLGSKMMTGEAIKTGERSQKMLISSISSLMHCCSLMLTNSFPVQVAVPVRPLLALIRRVLMVNGSLPETLKPFTTAMQQELVCLQLPVLHVNVLEVLAAIIKGLRSQLLPHAADIMFLLKKYFETCCLPELRTKVYSIIRVLLISMGAGMALYISEEVIDNIYVDLKLADDDAPTDEQSYDDVFQQPRRKKRKHGTATGPLVEQKASLCSEPKDCLASVTLKIAAIETLEALLEMGGTLSCDRWRRKIDDLMIEVATNACRGGWTHDEKPFHCKDIGVAWEDFQLVALRALLASILSPVGYRPPYLSEGLELFHKGKQIAGTKVAEFCSRALVALEVLIHPRALPLINMPLPNGNPYSSGRTEIDGYHGNSHDFYNILNDKYKEDISNSEVHASEARKDVQFDEKSQEFSRDQNYVEHLPDYSMPKERDQASKQANLDNKIESNHDRVMIDVQHHEEPSDDDRVMIDAQHHEEPSKTPLAPAPSDEDTVLLPVSSLLSTRKGLENKVSDAKGITSTTVVENVVTAHADNNISKMSVIDQDDESSDAFPDIVDADPDSDSD